MGLNDDAKLRPIIESVRPEIQGGEFPAKSSLGEWFEVKAAAFVDGHDELTCMLVVRPADSKTWIRFPMRPLGNDLWSAEFETHRKGIWHYTVECWIDAFRTWKHGLEKKLAAGQLSAVDLLIGAEIVRGTSLRADGKDLARLRSWVASMTVSLKSDVDAAIPEQAIRAALDPALEETMSRYPDPNQRVCYPRELKIRVERERTRFSSWYEFFPRSCGTAGRHGTFRNCVERLRYVRDLGFDVVYLPPIHPIGSEFRKGKNNSLEAKPGEPGSPWAIGSKDGGHKSIHPELGTLEDFKFFLNQARELGIEVALDLAYQCSPDHPYVKDHPEWFRKRPDGSIQYAENPPKKYQDVYPFDFECQNWRELWQELKSVIEYWIDQGVRIFRVDNPHTKSLRFWRWVIPEILDKNADVIFLSEAFTRPHLMYHLAKIGFSQSYTYFTWRESKWDFEQYMHELTQTEVKDFFRPNFWPNTPDILPFHLQTGGRAGFMARAVLAATLSSNYGIYGPAFELLESQPMAQGKEEYLNSEKYEIRNWDLGRVDSLAPLLRRLNKIRHENAALQSNRSFRVHPVDNSHLLCFSKWDPRRANRIVVVANLDAKYRQSGWVQLQPDEIGLDVQRHAVLHDLLTDARYEWDVSKENSRGNYVELDPLKGPAHVFRVTQ